MNESIGIFGLGLMGSSLACALRSRGFAGEIHGYARRDETVATAEQNGWFTSVSTDPLAIAKHSTIAVLCTPIFTIPTLIETMASALPHGAVITDVGSTKHVLQESVSKVLAGLENNLCFVGSHPMCGSEKTGIEAACGDLYHNATVVVVPPPVEKEFHAYERIVAMWETVGASIVELESQRHDELVARTSHLPHVMAALLTQTVFREGTTTKQDAVIGSGFRDTSRIAAGSPSVWHDIIKSNDRAICGELMALRDALNVSIEQLDRRDFEGLRRMLEDAAEKRKRLDS